MKRKAVNLFFASSMLFLRRNDTLLSFFPFFKNLSDIGNGSHVDDRWLFIFKSGKTVIERDFQALIFLILGVYFRKLYLPYISNTSNQGHYLHVICAKPETPVRMK